MSYEEGMYYGSITEELGFRSARRVAEFGPFNTPGEAFEAAYAALKTHSTATRLHIERGTRHEVLNVVDAKYVAEWNFSRATLAVIDSHVDEDVTDYPSELRARAAEAEREESHVVRHATGRAMRLGALEPWASSFARWAVRQGRTGDLAAAYDDWRTARGWDTRAEMDANVSRSAARAEFARSLSTPALATWIRDGSPVPWAGLAA